MAGATKLMTAGGGGVALTPASSIASDVTVQVPAVNATLLTNKTAGTVLQVVSATKTDAFSTTSTSFVDVTGLSVSITPTSATSKILVQLTCTSMGSRSSVVTMYSQLLRDSTVVYNPGNGWSSSGNDQVSGLVATYLDSPATTSQVTYKLQIRGDGAIVGINRPANASTIYGYSSITVTEIAA